MVDPFSVIGAAGAAGKALDSAAEEGGKGAGGLVSRVFGPSADEIGVALGRFTAYRVGNVKRIAEIADKKAGGREGAVAPRLAHSMLEDGSFCDDELMAEYLGGVLAGGRTPSGRDDRAVAWSKLVTSMSVLQLRAHFVFYREWAIALQGRTDVKLAVDQDAGQMYVEIYSLYKILSETVPDIDPNDLMVHVLSGLARLNLIHNGYRAGQVKDAFANVNLPFDTAACMIHPTTAGMELYGWACGLTGLHPAQFTTRPELTQLVVEVARPVVVLPALAKPLTP